MGAIMAIIGIICQINFLIIAGVVLFVMILVEILQKNGMLTFKYLFIPVFHKLNPVEYSDKKRKDSVQDVMLGWFGALLIYALYEAIILSLKV